MLNFVLQVLREGWSVLEDASAFLLIGLVLAGVLAAVVPAGLFTRHIGSGRVRSVLWASVLGTPFPLCSCGVLPTALGLRRLGATEGATVAFLVATPETGLDSVALSYSLTDLTMTLARPVAGVLAAIASGVAVNLLGPSKQPAEADAMGATAPTSTEWACRLHAHARPPGGAQPQFTCDDPLSAKTDAGEVGRLGAIVDTTRRVCRYAFGDLLDETGHWLALGIALSAVVSAAVPMALVQGYLGSGITSLLAMVVLGVPIYTCASSSTPVAATLVLKGLSPGAALVFLLTGPATNLGSLVVLLRFLGRKVVAVYLGITIAIAVSAGLALNWAYHAWGVNPRATFGSGAGLLPQPVKTATALAFLVLLARSMCRAPLPLEWVWLKSRLARLTGVSVTASGVRATAIVALVSLYLGSGLFEVQPGEVGVVSLFGRVVASDLQPGLHARLPWPFASDRVVDRDRVRRVEFGLRPASTAELAADGAPRQDLMFGTPAAARSGGTVFRREAAPEQSFFLTGDQNLIDLRFTLHYRVKDALAFAYRVKDPQALVRSTGLAAARAAAATSGIDAIYTTARSQLEGQIARAVQEILDRCHSGIEVVSVRLLYVHPPDAVHDAFRDVASAQEDKLRTVNRAETFAVEKVNQSKGEAAAMVEQALGFKSERISRAEGDAAGFLVRLRSYERAPELTKFRLRLEAAEAALTGAQKVITPGADVTRDIDMWLSRPFRQEGK